MHVHDSQGCPEFSVDMLHISCVDRENIHEMIDDFVFFLNAREEGDNNKRKTDIDVGSEGDQVIGVGVFCVC